MTSLRFFIAVLFSASAWAGSHPDTYSSYRDLAQHEREGRDYTRSVRETGAPISVFAIHGGGIDLNTHLIAEAVAGSDWNLYVFKGIKKKDNWKLHVTSANFEEPRALALAAKSSRCISIHGHSNKDPRICLGGANAGFRTRMARELGGLPFQVVMLCPGLEGTAPTNPVNECKVGGIQLEFSSALREKLFSDRALFDRTVKAIRAGAL